MHLKIDFWATLFVQYAWSDNIKKMPSIDFYYNSANQKTMGTTKISGIMFVRWSLRNSFLIVQRTISNFWIISGCPHFSIAQ